MPAGSAVEHHRLCSLTGGNQGGITPDLLSRPHEHPGRLDTAPLEKLQLWRRLSDLRQFAPELASGPSDTDAQRGRLTDRLDLRRPDPSSDLDELFVIFSDPEGWWYDPAGRHTDPETTRRWLTRAAARFDTDDSAIGRSAGATRA